MYKVTKKWIEQEFDSNDYKRGLKYFSEQRVFFYREREEDTGLVVLCCVDGSYEYDVRLHFRFSKKFSHLSDQLICQCDCLRFGETGACKHVVAALLEYEARHCTDPAFTLPDQTDARARQMLSHYLDHTAQAQQVQNPVQVMPIFIPPFHEETYPSFSFKIGREKLYVVRNIDMLVQNVIEKATCTYGKDLTLTHNFSEFEETSQAVLTLLFNQHAREKDKNPYSFRRASNQAQFRGTDFDEFFELYKGKSVFVDRHRSIRFLDANPTLHIQVSTKEKIILLRNPEDFLSFGDLLTLYLLIGDNLYRCDTLFRETAFPFLKALKYPIQISKDDMPAFCSCVLPSLGEQVQFEGDDALFSDFLPDPLTAQYYFDLVDDALTCKVQFQYGAQILQAPLSPDFVLKNVKRDTREENEKLSALLPCFDPFRTDGFIQDDPDQIYDFLTDGLNVLSQSGEIYISEKLNRMQLPKPNIKVGLSLGNGVLALDIDIGEFPTEELDRLFVTLKQKKRYHRLRDGSFLSLADTGFDQLSELSTMLQLNTKDLQSGHISMPTFRIPYVDSLLRDSKELSVSRSKAFQTFLRDFQTISDSDFTLPSSFESILRPYQKTGFRWLKTLDAYHFGGILADDMGLGKTVQVLSYLVSLQESTEVNKPSLIVCPSSLILNWGDEAKQFAPTLKLALIMGSAKERKELLSQYKGFDVCVTSYELLRRDLELYREKSFYACILDEAQFIKNQSTQASKAVKSICTEQRFALTGTPIENRLSELWNIFDFLMPGYLYTHNMFVSKLEKPILKQGDQESATQLAKLVQPFILRRMKDQVLRDLPPKTEHIHKLQMEEKQRKVYLSAVKHAKESIATTGAQEKMKIFAVLTQLRQICCDPHLCFENYKGESCKLEACISLCRNAVDNGHRILLFSQFTSMLDLIRARLDDEQISNFTLQGSTPKEKRAQLVKDFNRGKADVFLISLKAGGTGLNLTNADIVIHYDPWWNIAAQNQATDRAHRIGQTAHVQVYQLIAKDTIEEKILNLQEQKKELMQTITGQTEGDIMSMSKEDIVALLES